MCPIYNQPPYLSLLYAVVVTAVVVTATPQTRSIVSSLFGGGPFLWVGQGVWQVYVALMKRPRLPEMKQPQQQPPQEL